MRSIPAACLLALSPALALAGIVPGATTVAGSGPYTWTYQLQLGEASAADTDATPSVADGHGGAFTIIEFAGYVDASCASPDGWTCTVQDVDPADGAAADGDATVSLTWTYVRGPVLGGLPSGRVLGDFSAQSVYGAAGEVAYAARSVGNNSARNGSTSDNAGTVDGPSSGPGLAVAALPGPDGLVDVTPSASEGDGAAVAAAVNAVAEPDALALAGLGLVALGLTQRRARRRRGV